MNIQKHSVVSFDYTLSDNTGVVIDTSINREPLTYLHGVRSLIPGMERPWMAAPPVRNLKLPFRRKMLMVYAMNLFYNVFLKAIWRI